MALIACDTGIYAIITIVNSITPIQYTLPEVTRKLKPCFKRFVLLRTRETMLDLVLRIRFQGHYYYTFNASIREISSESILSRVNLKEWSKLECSSFG